MINDETIPDLIEHLRGTGKTLNEGCEDLFDTEESSLTRDQKHNIEGSIFKCTGCDIWVDVDEKSETGECAECFESNPNNDEEEYY